MSLLKNTVLNCLYFTLYDLWIFVFIVQGDDYVF